MSPRLLMLVAVLLWPWAEPVEAQTRLRLATVIPGTKSVELAPNGDCPSQGPVTLA